jgi:two-component system phosphate regulon sensor histidine kinase PhoR
MKRAIYYRLIALTFLGILVCSFISAAIHAVYTQNQSEEWLRKLTLSVAENYKYNADITVLSHSAGGSRITLIAPNGIVLADSETAPGRLANHAAREEVKYAAPGSVYIATRTSETLGEKYMYAAIKAENGNILRLSHGYAGLIGNLAALLPSAVSAILIALILSLFFAGHFSKSVTKPLEKMVDALAAHDYEKLALYNSPYYEIDKMMRTLKELLQKNNNTKMKLHDERDKVKYILSNMAEGFVLLDGDMNILLCNNSARAFFDCDAHTPQNIYVLTRNQTVLSALQLAANEGQSAVFDISLSEDTTCNIYVSPAKTDANQSGATMLIVDTTAQKKLEEQKRDFFSNASHELKTPVTSILGFSEMLSKGLVRGAAERDEIIGRIEAQAKRMSALIDDILSISRLESGAAQKEYTQFNFADLVKEAAAAVTPLKNETEIEIILSTEDVLFFADRRQMYALCVNLTENAVKYNKPHGKVWITLRTEDGHILFSVKDSGIGIPQKYHARVFARFFRVDYGRDKKIGGTGLGLSIVKHIVGLYGGKIALTSKEGAGTEIIVTLPCSTRVN